MSKAYNKEGKRVKAVFSSSSETIHVFFSRSQTEGRCSNVFFEGDTLYSYGYHFKLAEFRKIQGKEVLLINDQSYSVTTSKQQGEVRYSIPPQYSDNTVYLPGYLWDDDYTYKNGKSTKETSYIRGKAYYISQIQVFLKLSSKARENAFSHYSTASNYIEALNKWATIHRRQYVYSTTEQDNAITARAIQYEGAKAERQAERERKTAERLIKNMDILKTECGGSISDYYHKMRCLPSNDITRKLSISVWDLPTLCCISKDGTEVITSKSARVPVDHAKKLYPFILRARRTGKDYECPPNEPRRVGHYSLNSIKANGDIVIGCHNIPWSEVEYIGKTLGVID